VRASPELLNIDARLAVLEEQRTQARGGLESLSITWRILTLQRQRRRLEREGDGEGVSSGARAQGGPRG
jgi:hypothetical protein